MCGVGVQGKLAHRTVNAVSPHPRNCTSFFIYLECRYMQSIVCAPQVSARHLHVCSMRLHPCTYIVRLHR